MFKVAHIIILLPLPPFLLRLHISPALAEVRRIGRKLSGRTDLSTGTDHQDFLEGNGNKSTTISCICNYATYLPHLHTSGDNTHRNSQNSNIQCPVPSSLHSIRHIPLCSSFSQMKPSVTMPITAIGYDCVGLALLRCEGNEGGMRIGMGKAARA